jgi:type I restriction enzyme S subunit
MQYSSYDKYKPSRLEWIDAIPVGWDITRLRLLSKRYSGGTPSKDNKAYWQNGTIPWLNSGSVNQGRITKPSTYITELGLKESSTKWIPEEAIIIALAGQGKTKGTAAYTTFKTTCNQSMGVVVFDKDHPRFMYWWLTSQYRNIRGMASDDGRDGLNLEMLGTIPCPLPSIEEQKQIASFLDYKTLKIDQLIRKKKRLISKLEEKRIALITQAVTKGINKDVNLSPCGKDWLGNKPENWKCSYLKHFSLIYDCKHLTAQFVDDGYPLASIAEVKGWYVDLTTSKKTTYDYYKDLIGGERKPKSGDIIYSRNATVGEAAIVAIDTPEFAMGQDVCLIRCSDILLPEFLMYLLNSKLILQQLDLLMVGSTFKRINVNDIKNFTLLIPPMEEQKQIIEFLINAENKIESMIVKASEVLKRLEEYRTALITSAVTGKIDLREINIPKEVA